MGTASPEAEALERRRADWDRSAAEIRGLLREAHEVLADLRQQVKEARELVAELAPGRLREIVDEQIAAAVAAGLATWQSSVQVMVADAQGKVLERFDRLTADLLGEEDEDGGVPGAIGRFRDRQARLEVAVGLTGDDGEPVL